VVGVRSLTEGLSGGDTLLVDGFEGLVIINPSETTLFRYGKVGIRRKKLKDLVEEDAKEPALTKDGQPFQLFANADTPEEVNAAIESACEGVGLFRTEALFLRKNEMPTEEVQFLHYRELVEAAKPLSVTIRTLDLGGDKVLNQGRQGAREQSIHGISGDPLLLAKPGYFSFAITGNFESQCFWKCKTDVSYDQWSRGSHSGKSSFGTGKERIER
jgi:phosphoenolpyruvate-protein kinase (PTS system EI component)